MPVVPLPLAKSCMQLYDTLMKGEDVQKIHKAFTNSVTFQTTELAAWLNENRYLENADSIRICLGIYTPDAARQLGGAIEEGRITVFICPIKNGEEVDAYNVGQTSP